MVPARPRYSRASSWARELPGGSSPTVPSTHRAAPGPVVPTPIRTRDRPRITAAGSPLGSRPICSTAPSVPSAEYLPSSRGTSRTCGVASAAPGTAADICAALMAARASAAEVSSGTTMVGSTTESSSGSTGRASVSLIAHFLRFSLWFTLQRTAAEFVSGNRFAVSGLVFRSRRTYLWPGKRTADWRKTLLMRAKSLKGAAGIGGLTRLAPRGATGTTVKPPGVFPGGLRGRRGTARVRAGRAAPVGQQLAQVGPGVAARHRRPLLRSPGGDDVAAAGAAVGAEVDDVVGGLDDVEVVLDDDDAVPAVHERDQAAQQLADVFEVQPGGGLVQDVDGPAGGAALQFGGELDPLRFAAGQGGGGLAQADISQADVGEGLEVAVDGRDRLKEGGGFLDRHVQHVGDGLALVVHGQGCGVVPGAVADLARDVHVRQELHLDLDGAVAGAGFAAAAFDVEGEPAGLVAADLGLGGGREQLPDVVEHAGVGGRVGPGGPPDRALVHVHHLVQLAHPGDPDVPARHGPGAVQLPGQRVVEDVVDQRRLPRPRPPGHRDQAAQRERHIHILQVVLVCPLDHHLAGL